MKFGYNREEMSIIPLQPGDPGGSTPDKYASVLAAINLDLSAPNLSDASLKLTQFFATVQQPETWRSGNTYVNPFSSRPSGKPCFPQITHTMIQARR
jgi:hypothetical protein